MAGTLQDKVTLITGAASGIGRAAAMAFAREGAKVVVSDIDPEGGKQTAAMIREAGGQTHFFCADVTKASQVEAMIGETARVFGKLDFALNSAGIDGARAVTEKYPEETWANVININLTGVFLCMKYEIGLMLQNGGGVIINMASVAGVTGYVRHSAYTASKHGVVGLTKTAALEYAKSGIRVNALCPCYTRTPMVERMLKTDPNLEKVLLDRIPMGRLGTPEEVAAAAVYLCTEHGSFITGQALVLDGGIMAE